MSERLKGRKILITGAGSGIGRETAEIFAREGAALALVDLDVAAAEATAKTAGGTSYGLDVTDAAAAEKVVAQAAADLGGLDGIVNSAGILTMASIDDLGTEEFRKVLDVNVLGTFNICKAALPYLREAGKTGDAAIVNIASAQALSPSLTGSAYAASKAAAMMFSKSIAKELAPEIRVNVICPGATVTPMTDAGVSPDDVEGRAALASVYAMKRLCEPDQIANGILFLMSQEASAVTGIALAIDNGRTYH
ncbi:MAG: 3-oxoacyl-ACP reductase [Mameliella sp.]|nr:3-oxoacyl-ACP reductase [Mameliella sp.]